MGRATWLKRKTYVGSVDLQLWLCWSGGVLLFFLECACEGIFIWVSEGEAGVWWEDIELL